jgi:hypothetical protein
MQALSKHERFHKGNKHERFHKGNHGLLLNSYIILGKWLTPSAVLPLIVEVVTVAVLLPVIATPPPRGEGKTNSAVA